MNGTLTETGRTASRVGRIAAFGRAALVVALLVTIWTVVYLNLMWVTRSLIHDVIGLKKGTHLGESVWFFVYEVPKVLMLLVVVVYVVGVIRTFFSPERTRRILAGKRESVGNVLGALLGVVTPFCSCSAVPLFIGFVETGVPLGVTLSFLIAAPMINEVALIMLIGMCGWQVAVLYAATGLFIAIVAGWVIGRLKMERHVEPWVYEMQAAAGHEDRPISWSDRLNSGRSAVEQIVKKVWLFVVLGIAVGAGIHGYVPEEAMASIMSGSTWWSVPLAVVVGVPMYSNAAGIIPIAEALLDKGASLGTVLAFMMAVIALSLPEVIILRKVLRPRLIGVFVGVVAIGIVCVGYLFNAVIQVKHEDTDTGTGLHTVQAAPRSSH